MVFTISLGIDISCKLTIRLLFLPCFSSFFFFPCFTFLFTYTLFNVGNTGLLHVFQEVLYFIFAYHRDSFPVSIHSGQIIKLLSFRQYFGIKVRVLSTFFFVLILIFFFSLICRIMNPAPSRIDDIMQVIMQVALSFSCPLTL